MLSNTKILVIDDEVVLGHSLRLLFQKEGANVSLAVDGQEGLRLFFEQRPDLIILDIMMPDIDGFEVCRQIRLMAQTPIIMLTTRHEDSAMIKGLNAGADDFVPKPFSGGVLLARARAILRRAADRSQGKFPVGYQDDYLLVDTVKRRVKVAGEVIKLMAKEMDLLLYLVENAGLVLTYDQILDHVWGWEYRDSVDYVHVYISNLRRKLEQDTRKPTYLHTEYGIGYRFEKRAPGKKSLPN